MRSPSRVPPRRSARIRSARVIVVSSAFALVQVVLATVLQPVLTPLAVLAPVAYAAVAGVVSLPQLIAGRFLRARGVIVLTAVFAGCFVAAVSPLGVLTVPAFAVPAAAVEGVLLLSGYRWNSTPVWIVASATGGLVAGGISLVVIDASLYSAVFVGAILLARTVSAALLSPASMKAERMLRAAGLRS